MVDRRFLRELIFEDTGLLTDGLLEVIVRLCGKLILEVATVVEVLRGNGAPVLVVVIKVVFDVEVKLLLECLSILGERFGEVHLG